MKTKKILRILFAVALLISASLSLTTIVHAKMPAGVHRYRNQSTINLGDFTRVINGITTGFTAYGDSSTGYITEIYDNTDGVEATILGTWAYYYTPPLYGCTKVSFSVIINGTRYPAIYVGDFND